MSYQHIIHFTLAEANALLPEVISSLQRMKELKDQLDVKGYDMRLHRYFGGMGPNGLKAFPDQLEELVRLLQRLQTTGVVVKDIESGLVDFPAIRGNDEEVYLCYRLGEPSIDYWHRIEDGFRGRQHIDTL